MLKTREDYRLALSVVGRVINEWDPYGLLGMGCPEDEFSAEISDIVRRVHEISTPQDASRVVSEVFSKWFSPDDFPVVKCIDVGQKLYIALEQSGLHKPRNNEG